MIKEISEVFSCTIFCYQEALSFIVATFFYRVKIGISRVAISEPWVWING